MAKHKDIRSGKHEKMPFRIIYDMAKPITYDLLVEKYGYDIKKHKEMEKNCNESGSMTPLEILKAYRELSHGIDFQQFFKIVAQIKGETPEERRIQLMEACNETVKNNDMKNIQLSVEQARELLGKNPEVDVLILANFTKEELCEKPKLPTSLYELTPTGYFINYDDAEIYGHPFPVDCKTNLILFNTRKQAESAVAKAQLSRFMAAYNGDWTPDWNNSLAKKYCIIRRGNELEASVFTLEYHFLAFKTEELAEEFLKNFKRLIEIYVEL